jgi:transposase-like protein
MEQVREIRLLLADPAAVVADIAKQYGVSRTTLYAKVGVVKPSAQHQ